MYDGVKIIYRKTHHGQSNQGIKMLSGIKDTAEANMAPLSTTPHPKSRPPHESSATGAPMRPVSGQQG